MGQCGDQQLRCFSKTPSNEAAISPVSELNNAIATGTLINLPIFVSLKEKAANEYLIADMVEALDRKLIVFETAVLSKQAYMAGSEFSLVDIFYMPLTACLFTMGYGDLVNRRPLLAAWWQRVSIRPSWKKFGTNA